MTSETRDNRRVKVGPDGAEPNPDFVPHSHGRDAVTDPAEPEAPRTMRILSYALVVRVVVDDGNDLDQHTTNPIEFTPAEWEDYTRAGGEGRSMVMMAKELKATYVPRKAKA